MIIMDCFLGQHNPSNYFALTKSITILIFKSKKRTADNIFELFSYFKVHATMTLLFPAYLYPVSAKVIFACIFIIFSPYALWDTVM
ncbi:hypothetical protein COPCOM_02882 [Coprococcus comes ATCC 27758]|uniref:Uncharacterized protein n=1 Tax=Coprococcus comes ATCC 27758 TaxID=470146 RepID=C0BCJ1_9FIRM|nr:hypothetical protein COPCOM_02882 [Coprococcus comes ATCC 27758]